MWNVSYTSAKTLEETMDNSSGSIQSDHSPVTPDAKREAEIEISDRWNIVREARRSQCEADCKAECEPCKEGLPVEDGRFGWEHIVLGVPFACQANRIRNANADLLSKTPEAGGDKC
jgi:hypothetical protein